jgi:pyrophosphatase PpaX
MLRRYKTILFDMDGTLVDTGHLWDKNLVETLMEAGLLTSDQIKWFLEIRRSGKDPILTAFPDLTMKEANALYNQVRKKFMTQVEEVRPILSREELLAILDGKSAAIVTQAHNTVARYILKRAGILDLFDVLITSDMVERVKPDPDPIFRALEEIGSCPATYIGDSEADELAALRAGIDFYHIGAVMRYVRGHPL